MPEKMVDNATGQSKVSRRFSLHPPSEGGEFWWIKDTHYYGDAAIVMVSVRCPNSEAIIKRVLEILAGKTEDVSRVAERSEDA